MGSPILRHFMTFDRNVSTSKHVTAPDVGLRKRYDYGLLLCILVTYAMGVEPNVYSSALTSVSRGCDARSAATLIPNSTMANPYDFVASDTTHNRPTLDVTPQPDLSPFFDDFLPLPSPTPQDVSLDDALAQVAVGEERRRRNTEASARFRVRKKVREQALERTAAEMAEKVRGLEERVRQLERENGWLRGLIVERRDSVRGEKKKNKRKIKS